MFQQQSAEMREHFLFALVGPALREDPSTGHK